MGQKSADIPADFFWGIVVNCFYLNGYRVCFLRWALRTVVVCTVQKRGAATLGRKDSAQGMAAAAANRVQYRYPLGPYGGKLEKVSGNQKYLPQFGIYTEPCSQPTRLAPGILGHDLGHRRPYLGYHNAAKRVELPLRRAANQ